MKRSLGILVALAIVVVAGAGAWWWFLGRGASSTAGNVSGMFVAAPCPPPDQPDALAGIEGWAPGASSASQMGSQSQGNLGGFAGGLGGGSPATPSPAPTGGDCRSFSPAFSATLAKFSDVRKGLPTTGYDVAALGATFKSPDDVYAFVRDQIRTDAYAGVMRGSRGTLGAAAGSPADKALLLHDLLGAIGVSSSYVHAQLAPSDADKIVAAAIAPVALDEKTVVAGPNASAGLEAGVASAQSSLGKLRGVLASKGLQPSTDATATLAAMHAAVTDHWWVQAQIKGASVDLDPSLPGTQQGVHLGGTPSDAPAGELPTTLVHTVTVRLLADTGSGPQPIATVTSSSVDAYEAPIVVQMTGSGTPDAASAQSAYTPSVAVGAQKNDGTALVADGATPLRALYLEVQALPPGGKPIVHRHVVLDRRGAGGAVDPAWTPVRTAYALAFSYRGIESVGDGDPVYNANVDIDAMLHGALMTDYAVQHPGDPGVPEGAIGDYPYEAHRYFEYDASIRAALRRHDAALTFAYDHPAVAFYRQGFDQRGDVVGAVQAFDIVDDSLIALSGGKIANDANVERGFMDTSAEGALISGPGTRLDTASVFAAARQAGQSIGVVGAADIAATPPSAHDALSSSLSATTVAVAPASAVTLGGIPAYGWVETDLATGNTIGRMETGAGQAAAEEGVLHKFIGNYTYIKGFARCLNCIWSWAAADVSSHASMVKSDSDEAQCMANAVCQFAVDYAFDLFYVHGFEMEGTAFSTLTGPYLDLVGELLGNGPTGAVCSLAGAGTNPYARPILG